MTTVINAPRSDNGDGNAGWVVAVIILLAVVGIGAYLWVNYRRAAVPPAPNGTNINVTIPAPTGETQNNSYTP